MRVIWISETFTPLCHSRKRFEKSTFVVWELRPVSGPNVFFCWWQRCLLRVLLHTWTVHTLLADQLIQTLRCAVFIFSSKRWMSPPFAVWNRGALWKWDYWGAAGSEAAVQTNLLHAVYYDVSARTTENFSPRITKLSCLVSVRRTLDQVWLYLLFLLKSEFR